MRGFFMKCNKCGTKVTSKDKICPNCGAEIEKGTKKGRIYFCIIAGIILVLSVAIFKFNAIIVLSILAIVCVAVFINKKILNLRKQNKNSKSIEEHDFSDQELKKFSEYFVSKNEKYISSLGNGYIMNFFANGSLKRGFAIVSDKRVYFRGSCFSGQGKTLKKTDEERTVDIKDVTGSGFVYHRYIGVLIALFTAILTLLGGINGSAIGAMFSWQNVQWSQENANYIAKTLNEIDDGEKNISKIEKTISSNENKLQSLNEKLDELTSQQKKAAATAAVANLPLSDIQNSEIGGAYEDYLYSLQNIVENSNAFYYLDSLYDCAFELISINNSLSPADAEADDYYYLLARITDFCWQLLDGAIYEHCLADDYNYYGTLYVTPRQYCEMLDESSVYNYEEILAVAYGKVAYCKDFGYTDDDSYGLYAMLEFGQEYIDYDAVSKFENELSESFAQAYEDFVSTVAPDKVGQEDISLPEIVVSYLETHPDASFYDSVNLSDISTEYDNDIQEITGKIAELESANDELSAQVDSINAMVSEKETYQSEYDGYNQKSFRYFLLTTVAGALVALLTTFLISCILTFADYLKKRKTLFEIQYAGGRIAFEVSYYAKAEIDDFQKQLRRTKDFAEETATMRTVTVDAPAQSANQNSVPDDLRKYADLLKDGLISQEEYDAMKKKILGL